MQHTRGSVGESVVGQLKNGRKALNSRWRGSLSFLAAVLHISVHMMERVKGSRFDHCGPWPVAPAQVVRNFQE